MTCKILKFIVVGLFSLFLAQAKAGEREDMIRKFDIEKVLREGGYPDIPDSVIQDIFSLEQASSQTMSLLSNLGLADSSASDFKPFTSEEILDFAESLYGPRGQLARPGHRNCFTCTMRVLTPQGYVAIGKLNVGDQVLSFDEQSHKLVPNPILAIIESEKEYYGTIHTPLSLLPIEVTANHPFFLPDENRYETASQIAQGANLLKLNLLSPSTCELHLSPLQRYQVDNRQAKVRNLTLQKPPHNYIVEGILVHNVKGGI